jgi:hypothetical protein
MRIEIKWNKILLHCVLLIPIRFTRFSSSYHRHSMHWTGKWLALLLGICLGDASANLYCDFALYTINIFHRYHTMKHGHRIYAASSLRIQVWSLFPFILFPVYENYIPDSLEFISSSVMGFLLFFYTVESCLR